MTDDFDFDHFFDDLKSNLDDDSPFVEVGPRQQAPELPQEPRKAPERETAPRKREARPAPEKQPKKKGSAKDTIVGLITVVVIILLIVLVLKSCGGKKDEAIPEETAVIDQLTPETVDEYSTEIIVMSTTMLDDFIYDYKSSIFPDDWNIAMFDDQGAVVASSQIGRNGVYEPFMCVFTPVFENNEMTAGRKHYLSLGNDIFFDDGYCDEFFSNMADVVNGDAG